MVSSLFFIQVKEFVQLNNVYYAGSHGLDIMAPSRAVKSCDKKVSCFLQPNKAGKSMLLEINFFIRSVSFLDWAGE